MPETSAAAGCLLSLAMSDGWKATAQDIGETINVIQTFHAFGPFLFSLEPYS